MPWIDVPLTVTNTQNVDTPAPFQQLVQFNPSLYSPFLLGDFSNIRFTDEEFSALSAWLESYSSTSATAWVRLNSGIKAGQSRTLHMFIAPVGFDGQFWGEAPQLSPTYAEYDDGANVFNFYDNFAGTTLSSKWVANGASYTINNGLTYAMNGVNHNELDTATSFTAPYIIDYYGSGTASTGNGGIYFNIQAQAANSNSYLWDQWGSDSEDQFLTYINGGYTSEVSWSYSIDGNKHVYTLMVGPSDNPLIAQTDYNTKENFTSMPTIYTSGYFGPRAYSGTTYWQWVRVRAYPPNGVMPSVSVGSPKIYNYGYIVYPEVV